MPRLDDVAVLQDPARQAIIALHPFTNSWPERCTDQRGGCHHQVRVDLADRHQFIDFDQHKVGGQRDERICSRAARLQTKLPWRIGALGLDDRDVGAQRV